MNNEKLLVSRISDFTELFMAIYALNNVGEDNKIYFSPKIKENFINLFLDNRFIDFYKSIDLIDYNEGYEVSSISIDEFLKQLQSAKTKEYFADEFKYDVSEDALKADANLKTARSIIDSFEERAVETVSEIVNTFEGIQLNEDYKQVEKSSRKYIKLYFKKSED